MTASVLSRDLPTISDSYSPSHNDDDDDDNDEI